MLSKKTRYALMALAHLTRNRDQKLVSIAAIAGNEQIPQRFLEGILLELKKQGILGSERGKNGGYYLLRKPAEVTVAEVIVIFEGSLGMLACVCEDNYRSCEFWKNEQDCGIRRTFREVYDQTAEILQRTTLEDLAG